MKKLLALLLTAALLTGGASAVTTPMSPTGIYAKGSTVLIADTKQNVVLSLTEDGSFDKLGAVNPSDIYGSPVGGYVDGDLQSAQFNAPWDVAPFLEGYAVSDSGNNCIRYIAGNKVTTLAGSAKSGYTDAVSTNAAFNSPRGLAVDGAGTLYIADTMNNCIRAMDKDCKVTTFAGSTQEGNNDGSLSAASFRQPTGLCWYQNALYVADTGNHCIRKIVDGQVFTISGGWSGTYENSTEPAGGFADGWADRALFSSPRDVTVDESGIYVADTGNSAVRFIGSDGWVTTAVSNADYSTLQRPSGVTAENGLVYISDSFTGAVLTIEYQNAYDVFTDVPKDSWYASCVNFAVENQLFNGVSDTAFDPDGTMQRGMLAAVLARAAQVLDRDLIPNGDKSFSDVPAEAYYRNALAWAADKGVISGMGDGSFAPEKNVTRQEAVTMLYRLAKVLEIPSTAAVSLSAFSDSAEVAPWAEAAMQWAVGMGIVSGNENGKLLPTAELTRAQAAKLFTVFVKLK